MLRTGGNPYDVGAVVEAASALLSRRALHWDLSAFYPGLLMRVGPAHGARGTIGFAVDPRRKFDDRTLGYGECSSSGFQSKRFEKFGKKFGTRVLYTNSSRSHDRFSRRTYAATSETKFSVKRVSVLVHGWFEKDLCTIFFFCTETRP